MIHTINQAMLDSSKKTRLAVQDLSKLSPLPTYASLPKSVIKKTLLSNLKSGRWQEGRTGKMGSSTGLSPYHPENSPTKNFLFQPLQTFDSSFDTNDNPEENLQTHCSVRVGKMGCRPLERNISERYQKKIEVLRELKVPRVSQQLLTIAQFTDQALTSIPRHVQIFNQKLRLLKKSITPASELAHRRKEQESNQMPLELQTLRVIRKSSAERGMMRTSRKTQGKFRMYLHKKAKKEEVFKIEGWHQDQTNNQRHFYEQ